MPDKNWQFELEEYIKQGEPDRAEKSEAWQTAIGLQAVDGLNTSEYLLDTAKEHIEGKITIDEAQKRIHSYYEQRTTRTETENETKEADIVSARITKLLGEKAFQFSPAEWITIHRRLFEGVFDHAGQPVGAAEHFGGRVEPPRRDRPADDAGADGFAADLQFGAGSEIESAAPGVFTQQRGVAAAAAAEPPPFSDADSGQPEFRALQQPAQKLLRLQPREFGGKTNHQHQFRPRLAQQPDPFGERHQQRRSLTRMQHRARMRVESQRRRNRPVTHRLPDQFADDPPVAEVHAVAHPAPARQPGRAGRVEAVSGDAEFQEIVHLKPSRY